MRNRGDNTHSFLSRINLVANKINGVARRIILIAMITMTPVVFANVISRFLLRHSIVWSMEIARYSFVWITFLGTAVALRERSHAKISLLLEKAPKSVRRYLELANYVVMGGLSILLIVTGIRQVILIWPTRAAYMRFLSMGWMYMTIPICGFLMLFFTFVSIIELFAGEKGSETSPLPGQEEGPIKQ